MAHRSEHERITELEDLVVRLEERLAKLDRPLLEQSVGFRSLDAMQVQPLAFVVPPLARATDDDGGKVWLGDCEWETIHNDPRTSIRVHLIDGRAEMTVNDGTPSPLPRCNWVRASGTVRVHGTGEKGRRAVVEWKPV